MASPRYNTVRGLQAAGYQGVECRVYACVKKRHSNGSDGRAHATQSQGVKLSTRSAAWLLLRPPERLDAKEQRLRECVPEASDEIARARRLIERSEIRVRNRPLEKMDSWLVDPKVSGVPELVGFATSLNQDHSAVKAALTLPWSNGLVNGTVNRLKLLKRSMYGRAGLSLLKKRFLIAW